MYKTGITGCIGSGKSYVCRLLEQRGVQVYDCDTAAKHLMRTDPQLQRQLTALIGPDTYQDGRLNKARVAQFLLASEDNARAIDSIVHPAVFRHFEQSGALWVESALLFQCGMRPLVDRVVVVTAPLELRLQRVQQRDGISRQKALEWVGRQWPQERLAAMADIIIVNDGQQPLASQIDRLLATTCP